MTMMMMMMMTMQLLPEIKLQVHQLLMTMVISFLLMIKQHLIYQSTYSDDDDDDDDYLEGFFDGILGDDDGEFKHRNMLA